MKKITVLITIFVVALVFWGCASPEGDGVVALDGPILESVDRDGMLEFNGAVLNSGPEPVHSVFLVIVFKDGDGNIIEANSIPIFEDEPEGVLYPSERAFFSLSVNVDPGRIFTREVEIYYEESIE